MRLLYDIGHCECCDKPSKYIEVRSFCEKHASPKPCLCELCKNEACEGVTDTANGELAMSYTVYKCSGYVGTAL